jgi:hypothetical protein
MPCSRVKFTFTFTLRTRYNETQLNGVVTIWEVAVSNLGRNKSLSVSTFLTILQYLQTNTRTVLY